MTSTLGAMPPAPLTARCGEVHHPKHTQPLPGSLLSVLGGCWVLEETVGLLGPQAGVLLHAELGTCCSALQQKLGGRQTCRIAWSRCLPLQVGQLGLQRAGGLSAAHGQIPGWGSTLPWLPLSLV